MIIILMCTDCLTLFLQSLQLIGENSVLLLHCAKQGFINIIQPLCKDTERNTHAFNEKYKFRIKECYLKCMS